MAPPGPAQIVWVSSMIRSVPVRRVSSRTRLVVAGLGQDDADVGQGRLDEHGRHVTVGERRSSAGDVVELDDPRRLGEVDRRADVPAPARRDPSASSVANASSTEPW